MAELYHCFNKEPQGDSILASCFRKVNGKEANYLFAATHLTKALAFAFSYHDKEVILNAGIKGSDNEMILLAGGQGVLDKERHIRVFGFPDEGFTVLPGWRQAVSENPLPFSKARLVLETEDYRDLMKAGLQIFLLPEEGDFYFDSEGGFKGDSFLRESKTKEEYIHKVAQAYGGRWINEEQKINVCPVLQSAFPSGKGAFIPQAHLSP